MDAAGDPDQPRYTGVEEWVTQWLAPTLRTEVNEKRGGEIVAWCPQWWAHPEAVDRLEATWRAWEDARHPDEPTAMARWWLDVADPMLARLCDYLRGPFARCYRNGHVELPEPLPLDPAPEGWWRTPRAPHPPDEGLAP